jgi:ABC-type branched-subunit amino acid transport system substrate-binding protein
MKLGAMVPLTKPGWVEAGQQLLAGLELGVRDVNGAGGVCGEPLALVVRDTAADPVRAAAAVDELVQMRAGAIVGEYHSVVARAIAGRAEALGIPFLCSSAVLDELTESPAVNVARLSPPQSRGWRLYADFLFRQGHRRIAVAAQPSVYWARGTRILRDGLEPLGAAIDEFDLSAMPPQAVCDSLAEAGSSALLVLAGFPEPAVSIVRAVRADPRLADLLVGAPAGQPEFAEWTERLGAAGDSIPFLRYLPSELSPLGKRVERELRGRSPGSPSFVAFEGYDTILAVAQALALRATAGGQSQFWPRVAVEGTRGDIRFTRVPGVSVWQWDSAPVQVVQRRAGAPDPFQVLGRSTRGTTCRSGFSRDPGAPPSRLKPLLQDSAA